LTPEKKETPDAMKQAIWNVCESHRGDPLYNLRAAILTIGSQFGFNEEELIERGFIQPPRTMPPAGYLKGGHR
jgi:hypothetical protein